MNEEKYVDINGFGGRYRVSNYGNIISAPKITNKNPEYRKERFLKLSNHGGYTRVVLSKADGTKERFLVHRIVASHFIDNKDNKPYINHKNGVKSDNRVDNIEWVTPKENVIHALKTGLRSKPSLTWLNKSGSNHPKSKSVEMIDKNGAVINVFDSITLAAAFVKAKTSAHIGSCCKGKRKTSNGYNWRYGK